MRLAKSVNINWRGLLAVGHDCLTVAIIWVFAYLLRFNFEIPEQFRSGMWQSLVWIVPLFGVVFYALNLYKGIWRYASLPDLYRIVFAVLLATGFEAAIIYLLSMASVVPRSVLIIQGIFQVAIMGGSRLVFRAWKEHRLYGIWHKQGEPVVVVGADRSRRRQPT